MFGHLHDNNQDIMSQKQTNQDFQDYLSCVICMELPQFPMECQQCSNIFCKSCIQEVQQKRNVCPTCNKPNFLVKESLLAKRLIGNLEKDCQYCENRFKLMNLESHLNICPSRKLKCKHCNFLGMKNQFIEHIHNHEELLLQFFEEKSENSDNHEKLVFPKKNDQGRNSVKSVNGKFYCGGPLFPKCSCCNGSCGPTNGCNCLSCMKLDLNYFTIKKGILINPDGHISVQGQNGVFFCGRKSIHFECNNQKSCDSCQRLNKNSERYKDLL